VAAPVLAAAPGAPLTRAGELEAAVVDLPSIAGRRALLRRGGRQLGSPRPRREVGLRLLTGDSLDPPLDPHLAAERIPVEEKRRARIRVEFGCLTADVSREEDEAVFVGALEQHHPHRARAVRPRG